MLASRDDILSADFFSHKGIGWKRGDEAIVPRGDKGGFIKGQVIAVVSTSSGSPARCPLAPLAVTSEAAAAASSDIEKHPFTMLAVRIGGGVNPKSGAKLPSSRLNCPAACAGRVSSGVACTPVASAVQDDDLRECVMLGEAMGRVHRGEKVLIPVATGGLVYATVLSSKMERTRPCLLSPGTGSPYKHAQVVCTVALQSDSSVTMDLPANVIGRFPGKGSPDEPALPVELTAVALYISAKHAQYSTKLFPRKPAVTAAASNAEKDPTDVYDNDPEFQKILTNDELVARVAKPNLPATMPISVHEVEAHFQPLLADAQPSSATTVSLKRKRTAEHPSSSESTAAAPPLATVGACLAAPNVDSMNSAKNPKPSGPNWSRVESSSHPGRFYFFNCKTNERIWET